VADRRGLAYVVVGDSTGARGSDLLVLELATGTVLRRLPLSADGEAVVALAVAPDGRRLYVSTWRPDRPHSGWGQWWARGAGRLSVVDPRDGHTIAETSFPDSASIRTLSVVPLPPGTAQRFLDDHDRASVVFAALVTPIASAVFDDSGSLDEAGSLLAIDAASLDTIALWRTPRVPRAMVFRAEGERAYLLGGAGAPAMQYLQSLDLYRGVVRKEWMVPDGTTDLALTGNGKVYVNDPAGHQLWRFDAQTDTALGPLTLEDAPLAVAARPA
jgi:hypothetical protein